MNEIPTPETDAALKSADHWIQRVTDKSRDLERRLTIARNALEWYADPGNWGSYDCPTDADGSNFEGPNKAIETLELTKP